MPRRVLVLSLALTGLASGCGIVDWIDRQVNPPPPRIKVGKRAILVLPFADDDVRLKSPDVEWEVAGSVVAALRPLLPKATFVPSDALRDWMAQNPTWTTMPAPAIGTALKADLVLELNVTRFRTRERADSALLQGLVIVEPLVFDAAAGTLLWRPGPLQARWPKLHASTFDTTEETVRNRVVGKMGEDLTAAFFEQFEE